jgi:chromosome segregation ATPase
MNEILSALQEVLDLGRAKIRELDNKLTDVNRTAAQQLALANELKVKEGDINEREVAVKKIEDLVRLKDEGQATLEEANNALAKLKIQRDAFSASQDRVAKEHSAKATELADKENALRARESEINDREAKFDQSVAEAVKKILKK